MSFALETRHGSWVAQAPVKPKGISKRKKTFDEPRFRFYSETAGRFAELCRRNWMAAPAVVGCIDSAPPASSQPSKPKSQRIKGARAP